MIAFTPKIRKASLQEADTNNERIIKKSDAKLTDILVNGTRLPGYAY
jgi:hypothetical protein